MINKIIKFIDKYNLRNKTIIAGFSGGYDSLFLLDNLVKIKDKFNIKVIAAHYNHNWRGEKAKEEQTFCRNYCNSKNIEFYTETAEKDVKKTETIARELRYEFFERALNKYNADAVFTAHNFNDNAETLLYRLTKGTGITGLNGILPKRGHYYRPILEIKRNDIELYCRENNLNPNNDDSNKDNVHKRNLIRNEILPLLEQINPEVISALNTLAKIARNENEVIDEYLKSLESDLFEGKKIRTKIYTKLSECTKNKIIYNLIYDSETDYNYSIIERLTDFIEKTVKSNKPSKYSIGKDTWLYADKNVIEIIGKQQKSTEIIKINEEKQYSFLNYVFNIRKADTYEKTPDENSAFIDLSNYTTEEIVLRTRREGDIIQPLGFKGTMKLKKYLMEKNIPQHERDNLLLICNEKEVLWVAGIGLSDKIKTKDKPTHYIEIKMKEE